MSLKPWQAQNVAMRLLLADIEKKVPAFIISVHNSELRQCLLILCIFHSNVSIFSYLCMLNAKLKSLNIPGEGGLEVYFYKFMEINYQYSRILAIHFLQWKYWWHTYSCGMAPGKTILAHIFACQGIQCVKKYCIF